MNQTTDTRRFVTATYEVDPGRQPEFMALLRECEDVMRAEGLITERPAVRMRSLGEPALMLEIFEWTDDRAFDRAQENPKVLDYWGRYEATWTSGGWGISRFPEASTGWAQFESLD